MSNTNPDTMKLIGFELPIDLLHIVIDFNVYLTFGIEQDFMDDDDSDINIDTNLYHSVDLASIAGVNFHID